MANTSKVKVAHSCLTLFDPWIIYSPWNSPGQNTRMGSLSFPRGTSRDQTQVSRIAGGCFTSWVTREFSINTSEFIFPFPHVNDVKFPFSPKENAYSVGTGGNSVELHTCSKLFPLFPG